MFNNGLYGFLIVLLFSSGCSKENENLEPSIGEAYSAKIVLTDTSRYGFHKLQFIDYNIGFAVNQKNLYKTIDGGENWNSIYQTKIGGIGDFHFLNGQYGLCIGFETGDLTVYKTVNGGLNWETIFVDTNNKISGLEWVKDSILVLIGEFNFYHSKDAGKNWTTVYNATGGSAYLLDFIDDQTAYVMSEFEFLKTTDAGLTWNNLGFGKWLYHLDFITEDRGIIGTFEGASYTIDGGIKWMKPLALDSSFNIETDGLYAGHFVNENVVYFAGGEKIYKSFNSGQTFTQIAELKSSEVQRYYILNFYMLDELYGYAIARKAVESDITIFTESVIFKTTTGWE